MIPKKKVKKGKSAAKLIEAAKKHVAAQEAKALAKPKRIRVTAEEAKSRTVHIREVFVRMGKMWWELGAEVKRAIEDRVPEALGQSAHAWMESCFGDSWLKIYRAHRIMKALSGVEMEKLEKISEGNAYALARLPEKVRKSSEWIERATKLTNEKFREAADKFIERKTGIKDPMVKLVEVLGFSTVPKSFASVVQQAIVLAGKTQPELDLNEKAGRMAAVEAVFSDYVTTYGAVIHAAENMPF